MLYFFKRLLCCVNIHWSGRSDMGGMGDAIQCDICKCDSYGPGFVINDRATDKRGDFNTLFVLISIICICVAILTLAVAQ